MSSKLPQRAALILLREAGEGDHAEHGGGGRPRLDPCRFPSSCVTHKEHLRGGSPLHRLRRSPSPAAQGRMHALLLLAALLSSLPARAQEPPILGEGARNLPVIARHGMVVAQEGTAARVGLEILKKGGNAVDAAVRRPSRSPSPCPAPATSAAAASCSCIWRERGKRSRSTTARSRLPRPSPTSFSMPRATRWPGCRATPASPSACRARWQARAGARHIRLAQVHPRRPRRAGGKTRPRRHSCRAGPRRFARQDDAAETLAVIGRDLPAPGWLAARPRRHAAPERSRRHAGDDRARGTERLLHRPRRGKDRRRGPRGGRRDDDGRSRPATARSSARRSKARIAGTRLSRCRRRRPAACMSSSS